MLEIRSAGDNYSASWDAYVLSCPDSHFGQRFAWRRATMRGYGARPHYRFASRDGRIVGVLPLFEKPDALFSVPGGLLADDDAIAAALLADVAPEVAERGLSWIELRDQRRAWPGLVTIEEHCTMILPLAANGDAQWDALGTKLRNKVRKGLKSEFRVSIGRERVDDFHRVMCENMRDLGTPILGPSYFREVLDAFGNDAWLVILDHGREPVGAMLLVAQGEAVQQPWSSSRRAWFDRAANYALHWEAIRDCAVRGYRAFDFGRSQWHSGTFAFKEQWGAMPHPLYYQYLLGRASAAPRLDDQKGAFALAVAAWRRLPLPLAKALGPIARRRFPEAL